MRRQSKLNTPLFGVLLALLVLGCQNSTDVTVDRGVGTVTVQFVTDGSEPLEVQVPDVAVGETLESVMRKIEDRQIEISGAGTTAFLQSIDGVGNEGSKGWTFKVDGEFATQGIGKTTLSPPTTVEWSYGEFE
ncbi:MAG: DUF4430 domain-containing protein [Planctomycetota bacterium]